MSERFLFGIGASSKRDYLLAVKEAVAQAKAPFLDHSIDLALCFTTIEYAHQKTLRALHELLAPVPLLGCSTAAAITPSGFMRQGVALLLIGLPLKAHCCPGMVKNIRVNGGLKAGEILGDALLTELKDIRRDFALLLCEGLSEESPALLSGLQERMGTSFPIIGGSSSDDLSGRQSYVYFNDEVSNDAACAVSWGGKLRFGVGIKHGLKPLGKPRTVTRAVGNRVYEIDGTSASNVYEEYFRCSLPQLKQNAKRISILYPVGIYQPSEREYLIRNILAIEDNGSLVFQGNVPEGGMLRFMIGTRESTFAATEDAVEEAKLGLAGTHAQCIIVLESVSRLKLLGRSIQKELDLIKKGFGEDIPIFGMCSYGEQAPLKSIDFKGKTYFHNQSICLLALGT
jgi:hypothetical protein